MSVVMGIEILALALLLWRIGADVYLIIKNREWEGPGDPEPETPR